MKVTGPEAYDRMAEKAARLSQVVSLLEAIAYIEWYLQKPFENCHTLDLRAFRNLPTKSVFIRFPDATLFEHNVYNTLIAYYRQAGWGDLTVLEGDTPETEYQVVLALHKKLSH